MFLSNKTFTIVLICLIFKKYTILKLSSSTISNVIGRYYNNKTVYCCHVAGHRNRNRTI